MATAEAGDGVPRPAGWGWLLLMPGAVLFIVLGALVVRLELVRFPTSSES